MTIGSQDWEGLTLASGRYRITGKLGEGGMGFVYRALDQNIDSEVVIKVPRQAMMDDPDFAGRFTREIRSLVKLSHPHIVKVTDVGTYEGIPFAVMQYLAGGSLEDQRQAGPDGQVLPCDPRNVSRWLVAVAEALDYIHTQGYVHRDVKPGNILFDTLGHAFLSDFGVAKVLASSTNAAPSQTAMTGAGMVLGTPEYMAPELIMGEPFDGRADQYALAITVYEMLCGRRPFEHETKTKVLVLHTSKSPPPLTEWSPALPDRLSQAVLKGLAKDSVERYARCAELAKVVSACAEGVVARDDRVRLKCSACGRTGSMPAADFAKLKESGRRAACPACKSPIDVSTAVHAAPTATPGGTMKFSSPGNLGEYPVATAPAPGGATTAFSSLGGSSGDQTSPGAPKPKRGGTMAISASGSQGTQPTHGENRSTPRQGSGTLIERALPRSDEAAATAVFKSLTSSDPERTTSPTQIGPSRTVVPAWIWVVAGASTAAVLTAVVGMAFLVMRSGKEPEPDRSSRTAAIETPKPQATKPQTSPGSAATPTTIASLAKPSEPPRPPNQASVPATAQPSLLAPGNAKLASADESDTEKIPRSMPPKATAYSPTRASQPPAPASIFATSTFSAARLPKKTRHLDYPLEKIIAKARSYRDEIVVPAGMYSLTRSSADDQAGPRKYVVTECALKEQGPKRELHMTSLASHDLEIEPKVAAELDKHWNSLEGKVAILTLWVAGSGEIGIVSAQILQKFTPRLKPGFGPGQADIDYDVLFVSAEGSKAAKADDGDWQKVGRLNQLYLHHKHLVAAYRRKLQTADMAGLSTTMNNMYAGMMKGAAADAAAQRSLQRSISGQ
jgi:tRNA A-37 threonylcarbamoyl transferase component Bud32